MIKEFIAGEDLKENDSVYISENHKVYKVKTEREIICDKILKFLNDYNCLHHHSEPLNWSQSQIFTKLVGFIYKLRQGEE